MAGYSGKPLAAKLGITPGAKVAWYHAPPGYARRLGPLPSGVRLVSQGSGLDLIQYFTANRQGLASALPGLKARIVPHGAIWVCWPKQTSGVKTDLNENIIRHLAIQQGLVDVKVIAVDAIWSGLKLVIPRALRPR